MSMCWGDSDKKQHLTFTNPTLILWYHIPRREDKSHVTCKVSHLMLGYDKLNILKYEGNYKQFQPTQRNVNWLAASYSLPPWHELSWTWEIGKIALQFLCHVLDL